VSNLLWTVVPLVVAVFAWGWARWMSRPRGPQEASRSVADYERFRDAITRTEGPRKPRSRERALRH